MIQKAQPCTEGTNVVTKQRSFILFLCLLCSESSTSRPSTNVVPTFAPSHAVSQVVTDSKVSFAPVGSPPPTATAVPTQRFQLLNHFIKNQTQPTITPSSIRPTTSAIPTTQNKRTGGPNLATTNSPSTNNASLSSSPSMAPLKPCVKEWKRLSQEISLASASQGTIVEICTGIQLTVKSPILIHNATSLTLQCGVDGSQANDCVIFGGSEHFRIDGSSQGILFHGITFRSSSNISISVSSSSEVTFLECLWFNNMGDAAVITFNEGRVASLSSRLARSLLSLTSALSSKPINASKASNGSVVHGPRQVGEISFTICGFEGNNFSKSIIQDMTDSNVQVQACIFTKNFAGASIIAVTGQLDIERSCFYQNSFRDTLVAGASIGAIITSRNYGDNNTATGKDSTCLGASAQSKCLAFHEPVCHALDCFEDLGMLSAAILASNGSSTLELCEDTFFDLSMLPPIQLNASNIIITCGSNGLVRNNCVISGGKYQIELIEAITGVEFRGVTFVGSTVACINAAGSRVSSVAFVDCIFRDHTGLAVILDYYGVGNFSFPEVLPASIGKTAPPLFPSMTIMITGCTFENNIVQYSPLAVLGGNMVIKGSFFFNNTSMEGGGAIGIWFGGGVLLSQSCFISNVGNITGSVYVDQNSSIQVDQESYSSGDSAGSGNCSDIFLDGFCQSEGVCNGFCRMMAGQTCSTFTAPPSDAPSLAPSFAPQLVPVSASDCFGTWQDLSAAIKSIASGSRKVLFFVCAGAVLKVDRPIVIDRPATIECGAVGRLTNNCTVSGGSVQFVVISDGVLLDGLTLIKSTTTSVLAAGVSNTSVVFNECDWIGNTGVAVILAYSEAAGVKYTGQTNLALLKRPSGGSMGLDFASCSFSNNVASWASVASVGGPINMQLSTFVNNKGSKVGVISATDGASVNISSSCFIDNGSQLPGTVFVDMTSTALINNQNFGYDDRVGTVGECTDIFQETSGTCLSSSNQCEGLCSSFDSLDCQVSQLGFVVPTPSPSMAPSMAQTGLSLTPTSSALQTSNSTFASSPIFLQNMGATLLVVGGGIFAFFYSKGQSRKPY